MFHFPHKLRFLQKPVGADAYGKITYEYVSNNVSCQFLGRPREFQVAQAFGEEVAVDAVFSLPQGIDVGVDWRLVYQNVGYIVIAAEPQMTVGGKRLATTVYTRREKIIDGGTSYTQT